MFVFSFSIIAALLIVDYRDFPSKVIRYVSIEATVAILSFSFLLLLVWTIKVEFINYLKMPIPIALDCFLLVLLTASFVYGTLTLVFELRFSLKLLLDCLIIFVSVFLVVIRIYYCCKKQVDFSIVQQNIYDLKEIYRNNFSYNGEGPILLEEDAVDYDLLNRKAIINHICSSIASSRHASSYVVGLEGPWGSGKTTIINNVKKKLKYSDDIVIEDFDPWLYGSQEALLLAMFDTILEHSGIKYSAIKIRSIVNDLLDTVAENYDAGGIIKTFISRYNKANISSIKNRINSYLNKTDKNIVFIIDNIDRADSNNIIFLFKLIGIVFDLPRIVYVLSYDRNRLNAVFENTLDIDKKYTEKIIQQEISIPQIQVERLHELYFTIIRNILKRYGIRDDEINEYSQINNCICQKIKDIRNLKRIINSAFSTVFSNETILNKKDLLSIEVIKFTEPDLYNLIYQNRCFFISYDKDFDIEGINVFSSNRDFNDKGNNFFEKLFERYPEYKGVLGNMFPYVYRYLQGIDLENSNYTHDDYSNIIINARICSAKFFDLYFSYGLNRNLEIEKDISKTINDISKLKKQEMINGYMYSKIKLMNIETQKRWFEGLKLSFSQFSDDIKHRMVLAIFTNINLINCYDEGSALTAKEIAFIIISNYIYTCDCTKVDKFCKSIAKKYNCMKHLQNLFNKMNNTLENTECHDKNQKLVTLNKAINKMCKNIIVNNIDLYSDSNYIRHNIWSLKLNCDNLTFQKYINEISNDNNVYRVLYDTITYDSSQYKVNPKLFYSMFSNEIDVDKLVTKNPPKTDSQKFIFNVYSNFRHSEKDSYEESYVIKPKDFSL